MDYISNSPPSPVSKSAEPATQGSIRFEEGFALSFIRGLFSVINRIISLLFKIIISPTVFAIGRQRGRFIYNTHDYIRLSSLELCAQEINENSLEGNVAELGVYRGSFAQYINQLFPNRKLYLFDTFEGFDKRNFNQEDGLTLTNNDFSKTSIDIVLKKMKYPENCIVKKGFFPETAEDLENEKYAFISIDVDLYEPIYEGLKYFYPRLIKGGYIFVHDYNNMTSYNGVKKAVRQFSKENNAAYFPLSDAMGSVVFMK